MAQPLICSTMQKLTRASATFMLAGRHKALATSVQSLQKNVLPALDNCNKKQAHSSSDQQQGPSGTNVVSVSSIVFQDGLEIQELPILVRLLDKGLVPLANHTYTGELIRSMTSEDENFQALLQQCVSVKDVFKLLEIPAERVTCYSASAALCRMCELQKMNADWDDLHSFIRTAVMNELNDTVRKGIDQLSNETLVSLVSCYMNMESIGQECKTAINAEIQKRMVDGLFSLEELCSLSSLLHVSSKGDKGLINSIWVYIGNNYQDVQEKNVALVLASLPASHKYLLKVLSKQVHKMWWKMKADETVSCLSSLVRLNSLQVNMMMDFAHWLFLNIHQVKEDKLMQFVAAFIHFRFSDTDFITAVERYVGARGDKLDTNLLGLMMEYCRVRRYFSPTILDAAARHFTQFGQTYTALQIFTILRPFGQLNYLPKDCHQFLLQTEKVLEQRFTEFHPAHLAELLCSFAFVQKIPLNFVQKVLTPSFLSQVKDLPNSHEVDLWLEMLQSAVILEARGVRIPCLYKKQKGAVWRDDRLLMLQSKLTETLERMFGSALVKTRCFAANTVYTIDAEMHLTKDRRPVPVNYQGAQPSYHVATKLAIMIMAVDHFCVNSGHLLGEFSMRLRHLRKLGYTVVEVYDADFLHLSSGQRENYMAEKLKKWIHSDFAQTSTT